MPSQLRRYDELDHIHFLTFSCFRRLQFFRHDDVKLSFIHALAAVRTKHGVRWLGYVVMPEHVHLTALPQAPGSGVPVPISVVLHDLKQRAGYDGKEALRSVWRQRRSLGTTALDAWATGSGPKPFWKLRGYDFNTFGEAKLLEKLEYMHLNPVRRGLVERPEQWRWSSFRHYEYGDEPLIKMDWDGRTPLDLSSVPHP